MTKSDPVFEEMARRLSQLIADFRNLDAALPAGVDKQPFQEFFKALFSLHHLMQKQPSAVEVKGAGTDARERHFEHLYKFGLLFHDKLEAPELLNLALDTLVDIVKCRRGFIATLTESGDFSFVTARNFNRESIPEPEIHISRTVIQRAWQLKREVQIEKGRSFDQSMLQKSSIIRREGGALICVPVLMEFQVRGVIYLDQFADDLTLATVQLIRHFSAQLALFMKHAEIFAELRAGSERLMGQLKARFRFERIIGKSKAMAHILKTVAKVAPTDASMLIEGETGTGKDLLARAIHENSARCDGPYIEVDCGALAENLIESELFGHVRGAFTGAQQEKVGLLAAAHGGTLFLDEINNMPSSVQVKLLRVLQQRKLRRIGDTQERDVNFRLVVASSKSLEEMVKQGSFREDLFYRIRTVSLQVPPLRARTDDIVLLAQHFLGHFTALYGKEPLSLSTEAVLALERHSWPGNVRELEHVVERAIILADGPSLTQADFPFGGQNDPADSNEAIQSLETYVKSAKKYYITKVLRECDGKKVLAAEKLQINRSHLFQLIKQLGIDA